jgi:hypothetical protein
VIITSIIVGCIGGVIVTLINELRETVTDMIMQEAFELAWFDNVAILNQVKRETALAWFRLGYKAAEKRK